MLVNLLMRGNEEGEIDLIINAGLSFQVVFPKVDFVHLYHNSFDILELHLQLNLFLYFVLLAIALKQRDLLFAFHGL